MHHMIRYFQSPDGASIAAARGGRGPPLVVSPSFGSTIETDWPLYAAAFPDHEVITWDRRGFGLSERGSPCVSAEPYLQDVQAVIDGFDLPTFGLTGTLMGVVEAAWLSAKNPERVEQLVLRMPCTGMADWAAIPGVAASLATLEHDWDYYTESFARFIVGWGNPDAEKLAAKFRAITSRDELKAMFQAFIGLDLTPIFRNIRATTLIEHNPAYFFPASMSRRVAAMIGDCQLSIYNGSPGEFLNDFSRARQFLGGQIQGEPSGLSGPQTIMFTDLVSSTALTEQLGDEAAQEWIRRHDAIVRAALDEYGGREVKHTGDGIMASFISAVSAVAAALQIERRLSSEKIGVRIGLNAGEPVLEGGDLFGNAVQLAARLADEAMPGPILVSNVVRELCAGKHYVFEAQGNADLKGFSKPVAVYAAAGARQ